MSAKPTLLVTTTGEPYQPVRLKWTVPGKPYVLERLEALACIGLDAETNLLTFWNTAEAKELKLGTWHGAPAAPVSPLGGRLVILGTFRFPDATSMVLEVRSILRATEIARMLRRALGARAKLTRVRVVNRWFAASEGAAGVHELDKALDRNVTVIRWEDTANELEAFVKPGRTPEERQALWASWHEARRKLDVPLVEDFPCHPEEENEEMRDLATTLGFRLARAGRHWAGEKVTLQQVIEEAVAKAHAVVPGMKERKNG